MLSERYLVSVSGPPIANNTAIAKDVGIYEHTLHPSHSTANTFKKSSAPHNCLAVNDTHVFAAQQEKSTVHVYARARGNQEVTVTFQERIRSLLLQDQVLVLGTEEGRVIIWEVCKSFTPLDPISSHEFADTNLQLCTGRQVTTPACHIQAITCMASTPFHLVTGSDDSNIHVWQMPRLLELDASIEHEPLQTLSNHRAAIASLAVSQSINSDTNVCISASKDKSCIIWNYQAGVALRTVLFPSSPLSICLDPCARAFYVSSDDGSLYAIELFAEGSLIGSRGMETNSAVVQASEPFGAAPQEAGPAACLGLSYDGTVLLSGHARGHVLRWDLSNRVESTEVTNLNVSVTNLVFDLPLQSSRLTRSNAVVKPFLGSRSYNFTAQFESDLVAETKFDQIMNSKGFSQGALEQAVLALQTPQNTGAVGDDELRKENEELWDIINEQRALQKKTLQRYLEVKPSSS